MEGAGAPKFRPYWIRYIVAFWAGAKLRWVRDNIIIACLCSIAPGLIAAGISAALSDHKWRVARRVIRISPHLRRIVCPVLDVEARGCPVGT